MGIRETLSHSYRIAWKDLLDLRRNRLGLVLLVFMPLFIMGLVGLIYPSSGASVSNLPVAVVNLDAGYHGSTVASQTFISVFDQINNSSLKMKLSTEPSVSDAKNLIQSGSLEGAIIIPNNFSESLLTGKQGEVIVMTDQSNPQVSAVVQSVLSGVFSEMGTAQAQQNVRALSLTLNASDSLAVVQPFKVQTQGIVPGTPNYFEFVAPGIMAMIVMNSVMTGLPGAISQEKEVGTMDGIMVAPINRLSIILGKSLSQTARGMLQAIEVLVLGVLLFGIVIHGNVVLVLGLLMLTVYSFVGLGILITSIAKDQQTATMLLMTLMFPMMFLSGVFFPIQQMPWYMQDISKMLPLTYASDALRKVMVLGAGMSNITTDLAVLIVFGTIMIAVAVPVFRREMTS